MIFMEKLQKVAPKVKDKDFEDFVIKACEHYYRYLQGEDTSTNPMATIYAWSGALRKRAELDCLDDLAAFADKLEEATIKTIEDGVMTGDLYLLSKLENKKKVNTEQFLREVAARLREIQEDEFEIVDYEIM